MYGWTQLRAQDGIGMIPKDHATSSRTGESASFSLKSTPSEVHDRFVREVIDRTLAKSPRKQPHQCVTVKLPYTDYARVTRVREKWELNQTDLIRFFFEMALPILEVPSDEFRPVLEAHRNEVRAQRDAEAKKRGRTGLRAPSMV